MSADDDLDDFDEDGGGGGAREEEPTIDKDGYHIVSNAGKFQARLNPLQLKLEEEKKKKEAAAKEAAKREEAARRAAKFGGITAKAAAPAAAAPAPAAAKSGLEKKLTVTPQIDSRMQGMIRSGIATKNTVGARGRGARGRGGATRGGGRASGGGGGDAEEASTPSPSTLTGGDGGAAGGSDSDSSTERAAAARAKVRAELDAAAQASKAPADKAAKQRADTLIAQRRASRANMTTAVTNGAAAHMAGVSEEAETAPAEHKPVRASVVAIMDSRRDLISSTEADASVVEETRARARSNTLTRMPSAMPGAAAVASPAPAPAPLRAPVAEETWSDDEAAEARPTPPTNPSSDSPVQYAEGSLTYVQVRALLRTGADNVHTSPTPERYMTPDEFARVLEITPGVFAALPRWQQIALRKKCKLYVPRQHRGAAAGVSTTAAA